VRFEVFTAVRMITYFSVLAPCRPVDANVSEKHTISIFRAQCLHLEPRRWRQYVSPKRRHLPTSLHGAKTQKYIIIIFHHYWSTSCAVQFNFRPLFGDTTLFPPRLHIVTLSDSQLFKANRNHALTHINHMKAAATEIIKLLGCWETESSSSKKQL
jgi:hypothetical protein